MSKAKFTKKKLLAVIVLLNIYFITFFGWYWNVHCMSLDLNRVRQGGAAPITVFAPIAYRANLPIPNGIQTAVSCLYAPLSWFMERQGLGYYYYSGASFEKAAGIHDDAE